MMDNANPTDTIPSYIDRVIGSDAARKGAVALATGLLFAAVSEAIWPSK